jgi:hypothetical protein
MKEIKHDKIDRCVYFPFYFSCENFDDYSQFSSFYLPSPTPLSPVAAIIVTPLAAAFCNS